MCERALKPSLPPRPQAQGRYRPVVVHNGVAYSAGMTPRRNGVLIARGLVGRDIEVSLARELAGFAAGSALAAIADSVGGLEQIVRCLQLTVYISAPQDFQEHSTVADGSSDALLALLGQRGTVARAAVGVFGLPSGAPVEVVLTAGVRVEPQ